MIDHDAKALQRGPSDPVGRGNASGADKRHDAWFRDQVQTAIDGMSDGSNREIADDEWAELSRRKRLELQRLIDPQGR